VAGQVTSNSHRPQPLDPPGMMERWAALAAPIQSACATCSRKAGFHLQEVPGPHPASWHGWAISRGISHVGHRGGWRLKVEPFR